MSLPTSRGLKRAINFSRGVAITRCYFAHSFLILGVVWSLFIWPPVVSAREIRDPILAQKDELEKAYRKAVVYVSTEVTDNMDVTKRITGSGFIISNKGHIITANHVIPVICDNKKENNHPTLPCWKKRGTIQVRIGSNRAKALPAEVIKDPPQDFSADLALLKLVNPPSNVKKVKIGNPKLVERNKDWLYLAGFPSPEDFFITKGELQDTESRQLGKSNRWVAQVDKTWGDSGGPVFWKGEVMGILLEGNTSTHQNTLIAPVLLADKYLETAKVWPRWKQGKEALIENLASRSRTVADSIRTAQGGAISIASKEEFFKIRERQNNQDASVREYRYRLLEVGSALNKMQRHFKTQDLDKALDALSRGDAKATVQLLKDLSDKGGTDAGEAYYQLGSIAEINIEYERALSWYSLALSRPNPKAIYFDAAAEMANKLGDRDHALEWAKESVRLREQTIGKEEPGLATALCRLGQFVVEYDPNTTIQNCEKALGILGRYPGQELEIAETHDNLGAAYEFSANYSRAEEEYLKALYISERIGAVTQGVRAQELIGNVSNNLAGLYRSLGRYRDSLPLTEKAVGVNERVLGRDHPRLGINMAELAVLNRCLGDYGKSEKLFQKARHLLTSTIGRNNRHVGVILYHMAPLALIQKRDEEALKLANESLEMFEKLFGNGQSLYEMRVRMIMAEIKSVQGQYEEALRDLDRAEMINQSKHYSSRDSRAGTLRILLLRAAIHIKQSKFEEANTLLGKAQEFSTRVIDPNDPLLGELSFMMGKMYSGTGQLRVAEIELEKAQHIYSKSLGPQHPKRAAALRELAQVQRSLSQINISAGTDAEASKISSAHPDIRVITVIDL